MFFFCAMGSFGYGQGTVFSHIDPTRFYEDNAYDVNQSTTAYESGIRFYGNDNAERFVTGNTTVIKWDAYFGWAEDGTPIRWNCEPYWLSNRYDFYQEINFFDYIEEYDAGTCGGVDVKAIFMPDMEVVSDVNTCGPLFEEINTPKPNF
ncbi:hypothetical protein FBT53_12665, partial [Flavobacterium sp. ASW18X]